MGLTATFERLDGRDQLVAKYAPVIAEVTLDEAIAYRDELDYDGWPIPRITDDTNIILINIESGVESEEYLTIMNDSSNKKKYPSDVLASCINASCKEYNFDTRMLSGVITKNGWRLETSIEKNLI